MNIETANRLLQYRKQHNLSQEDLAAKIGVSRQAISKWERAEASPDTDNLILLADIYGVSLDELLKGEIPSKKETENVVRTMSVKVMRDINTITIILTGLTAKRNMKSMRRQIKFLLKTEFMLTQKTAIMCILILKTACMCMTRTVIKLMWAGMESM